MKNFYQALDLPSNVNPQHLIQRLEELQSRQPILVEELTAILLNQSRRADYNLLHAQYQVIAQVYQNIGEVKLLDTNNWSARLADFNDTKSWESTVATEYE